MVERLILFVRRGGGGKGGRAGIILAFSDFPLAKALIPNLHEKDL